MGKSTTANMFAEMGVPVWDADATVAQLYEIGGAALPKIAELVPEAVGPMGVDRKVLKSAIANDPALLAKIETCVHPLVAADRDAFISRNSEAKLILLDIPLFFETGTSAQADAVLVVTATEDVQRERVLARGTMTEAEFEMIKARQLPDAEKQRRADYIIETQTLEQTRVDVQTLINELGTN